MADKIKGITIELNGDATGLNKAIDKATSGLKGLQSELKTVDKDLKLSPDSIMLLEQKQGLLTEAIEKTGNKLDVLKTAYEQVEAQAKAGTVGEDKFRAVQRQLVETQQQFDKYQSDLKNTSDKLKELSDSADSAGDNVKELGDDFEGTVEKVERFADVAAGDAIASLGDRIGEAGEKVKEVGGSLLELNNEYDSATKNAAAYFGETGEAAEQTASVVENVYKSGLGDSMGAVSEAVIAVKKNLEDLNQTDLENITSQAIILEETYGIDMNETLRGVNSLMEQFGLSAQEAMDYIVAGTQNGLDKTNELGDNLSEYAGKFSQAGYSAQEYFQLLNNGLDGGAYNLDKVNDAINEVTTRLADGTIEDSLDLYSIKTRELFEAWKNGEASQKDVINSIIWDIDNMATQQESLNLAATAFGTMAEDGNLKFITSLTTVGDAYDNVTGKAQQLNDATTTDGQQMEAAWRQVQLALLPLAQQLADLAVEVIPPLAEAISGIVSFLADNPVITNIVIAIGAVISVLSTLMPIISTIVGIVTAFGTGVLLPAIGIIAGVAAAITAVIAVIKNWGSITEWFGNLWDKICSGLTSAWESVKAFFAGIPAWWSGIWTQVKTFFTQTWESLKATAASLFTAITENIKEKFTSAKETVTEIWTSIKEWISATVNTIKENVITVFGNIVSGVKEKATAVKDAVVTGIQGAIDFIKSLPSQALQWGKDFINGLADGIRSAVGAVKDAVKGIADTITSWLHFSRPDVGPLRYYEEWMPDFMKGLAKGINDNADMVTASLKDLTSDMSVTPEVKSEGASGDIADLLTKYLPIIASEKGIYIDGGALIGRYMRMIDGSLGKMTDIKSRGGAQA